MYLFFDTEFTGLNKEAKLISIGIISEDGKEFYAEVSDLDKDIYDEWLKCNVFDNTITYGNRDITSVVLDESVFHAGNLSEIHEELSKWLSQFDEVQLVSDVAHYDMVLFIDLFGSAFELPTNVCPYCHDINQDIAAYENITDKEAFNVSRELFVENYGNTICGEKHNALYDAKVIQEIFRIISMN